MGKVRAAINQAGKFHKQVISNKYHPYTYAQYGSDRVHLSVGTFGWVTNHPAGFALTADQLRHPGAWVRQRTGQSELVMRLDANGRSREIDARFEPTGPDSPGDGTVPFQSGQSPKGQSGVRDVYRTQGHDHQGSYADANVLNLLYYLIARTVKELV